jgi:hypothetical protein
MSEKKDVVRTDEARAAIPSGKEEWLQRAVFLPNNIMG